MTVVRGTIANLMKFATPSFFIVMFLVTLNASAAKVGEEFPIDEILEGPMGGCQEESAAAFNGTDWLVVWINSSIKDDIWGIRVSADGNTIDATGFPIATGVDEFQTDPTVVFDGLNWLVVWVDSRNFATSYSDLWGARVSPSGVVLDPDGFPVVETVTFQDDPSLAFDGTNSILVWSDRIDVAGPELDIFGARIASDGSLVDDEIFTICGAAGYQGGPDVDCGDDGCLVVWNDERGGGWGQNTWAARISTDGVVQDPDGQPVIVEEPSNGRAGVASNGVNYLVVCQRDHMTDADVVGARVTGDFNILDATPIEISSEVDEQYYPDVASDGSDWYVIWSDRQNSHWKPMGTRVSADGSIPDSQGTELDDSSNGPDTPSLGFGGNMYFGTWGYGDIFASRIATDGTLIDADGFMVSLSANSQYYSEVGFNGEQFLVSWWDTRKNETDDSFAYTRVFDVDGNPLMASKNAAPLESTRLSFDGQYFSAVWHDLITFGPPKISHILSSRLTATGEIVDSAPYHVCDASIDMSSPYIASGGDGMSLVAWEHSKYDGTEHLWGGRITSEGQVLDIDGFPISEEETAEEDITISFGDDLYLVVFNRDYGDVFVNNTKLFAVRVRPDGDVLDAEPIEVCMFPGAQVDASAAFDGENWLVVWRDSRYFDQTGTDIYGTRISSTGEVLDQGGFLIADMGLSIPSVKVVFDGTDFVVSWIDQQVDIDEKSSIWATRVSPDGTVRDPEGIALVEESDSDVASMAMASDGLGRTLVVHCRYMPDPEFRAARTRGVMLRSLALGEVCIEDEECSSDLCIDGVCSEGLESVDAGISDGGTDNNSGGCGCETVGLTAGSSNLLEAMLSFP